MRAGGFRKGNEESIAMIRDFIPKEISWLSFNERVLQEADDPANPLVNRIKFLGIYSSNMDEFFEVRVATLKRLSGLGKKGSKLLGADPRILYAEVQKKVMGLQKRYDEVHHRLIEGLKAKGIHFVREDELSEEQALFIQKFFKETLRRRIFPVILYSGVKMPELQDRGIYLIVLMKHTKGKLATRYAVIEIPTDDLDRFLILPKNKKGDCVIMLDDAIRFSLPRIFATTGYDHFEAFDLKLTRDAEIELADDLSTSYLSKVNRSLKMRKQGNPVRLGYDEKMPGEVLAFVLKKLKFKAEDTVIPGGRYHNFKDFRKFPDLLRDKIVVYPPAIEHPILKKNISILKTVEQSDVMLHYPYHSFHHVIDMLREASIDPKVKSIKITIYRVAKNSSVVNALINAVKNGKDVTVLLELQARFDEMNNIAAANTLKDAGANVIFGIRGLKVHSKLLIIAREIKGGQMQKYCAISTGNFNEETAKIYTDFCLLTTAKRITTEVDKLFDLFENNYQRHEFKTLLVSPYSMRSMIEKCIDKEIENAREGRTAFIDIKMNNLSDKPIIELLYRASRAGVKIRLLVRSMFSLVAGEPGLSENIEARCIVDKYLEHSRFLLFRNGGDELCYLSSADILPRSLDRRIEVACPIFDKTIHEELREIFELQWSDNTKARVLDRDLKNEYYRGGKRKVRAQNAIYEYHRTKQI